MYLMMWWHSCHIMDPPIVPPVIREGSSLVTAHVNQKVALSCEVEGDAAASVLWRKDGLPVLLDNRYICLSARRVRGFGLDTFIMSFSISPKSFRSEETVKCLKWIVFKTDFRFVFLPDGSMRIESVQLTDAGRYYCSVSNKAGSDLRSMELRVYGTHTHTHGVWSDQCIMKWVCLFMVYIRCSVSCCILHTQSAPPLAPALLT